MSGSRGGKRRRYNSLPTRDRVRLVLLFLAIQLLAYPFLSSARLRIAVAVLTAAVLAVGVVTRRRPSR